MDKNKKNASKVALTIGVIGAISGVFLILSKEWFIGIFGTIASAGIAYKGYVDLKSGK
jgi:hypothetical protein